MTTKEKRPVLTGQRLRSRKRDEKQKYDPVGFRDELVEGLNEAESLEQAAKYLDGTGLDYRRYAEPLFDIIIAGGLLEPGGSLSEGDTVKECIFSIEDDDRFESYTQLFILNLVRRLKYLQVHLEEEITKLLKFLTGFEESQRAALARMYAYLLSEGIVSAKPMESLALEALVKADLPKQFLVHLFRHWLSKTSLASVERTLRKGGVDAKFKTFFQHNEQSYERMQEFFSTNGLPDVVTWLGGQRTAGVKREIHVKIVEMMEADEPSDAIIEAIKVLVVTISMQEKDIVPSIFNATMEAPDWNKKADLVGEQALRHLKTYHKVLAEFCHTEEAQVLLINKIQVHFYENQNFLKTFDKVVLLLYKLDVLGEDAILRWYDGAHSSKGKGVFLQYLKKMVDWLKSAEEESDEEEED